MILIFLSVFFLSCSENLFQQEPDDPVPKTLVDWCFWNVEDSDCQEEYDGELHLPTLKQVKSRYRRSGSKINITDQHGRTPLMLAVFYHNNLEIVKFFLEEGVDIDAQDEYGRTALMHAFRVTTDKPPNTKIIKVLLSKGASKEVTDFQGLAAYDYCMQVEGLKKGDYCEESLDLFRCVGTNASVDKRCEE